MGLGCLAGDRAAAPAPRARIAEPAPDPESAIIARRRVPCICPQQDAGAVGVTLDFSTARGVLVEQVSCDSCPRRWTRITAQ